MSMGSGVDDGNEAMRWVKNLFGFRSCCPVSWLFEFRHAVKKAPKDANKRNSSGSSVALPPNLLELVRAARSKGNLERKTAHVTASLVLSVSNCS